MPTRFTCNTHYQELRQLCTTVILLLLLLVLITPTGSKHSTQNQYNNTENPQKHEIKNRIKHTTIYEKHKCSTMNHTIHEN